MKHLKRKPAKKGFIQQVWMKKTFFSLLFITTLAACTNDDVISEPITQSSSKLNLTVDVNPPQSRGILEGNALADGSEIGILLDDGGSTDYDAANNIKFTAVREDGTQKWQPETDIILSGTKGTLYAYYPYKSNTDLSAIPVETATQTDYLYATPVQNVNEDNANVGITLNHMLSNVKVAIARGTYVGTGNITNISVESDGFATGGTFNAAQETPAFTSVTGVNDAISQPVSTTLGGTAANIMVVPTGNSQTMTFTVTIDGENYTATSTDVELEGGNSYEYTLSLNSTFMSVASVAVNPWTSVPKGNLTLEKYNEWKFLDNGVYAVGPDGEPVSYEDADNSCIAVAIIAKDAPTPQRIMIEKNGEANQVSLEAAYTADNATNNTYKNVYWGVTGTDQSEITTYTDPSSISDLGYVPLIDNTYADDTEAFLGAYTTWSGDYALNDWNGKENTSVLMASSERDVNVNVAYMGTWCRKFNQTPSENQGYNDWYIPSLAQLALINSYTGRSDEYGGEVAKGVNAMLEKIGGTKFDMSSSYWSSSENSARNAWTMMFEYAYVSTISKNVPCKTRFIRDIIPANN